MTAKVIALKFRIYTSALELLASDHTAVSDRKGALAIRDEFQKDAPVMVGELLALLGQGK